MNNYISIVDFNVDELQRVQNYRFFEKCLDSTGNQCYDREKRLGESWGYTEKDAYHAFVREHPEFSDYSIDDLSVVAVYQEDKFTRYLCYLRNIHKDDNVTVKVGNNFVYKWKDVVNLKKFVVLSWEGSTTDDGFKEDNERCLGEAWGFTPEEAFNRFANENKNWLSKTKFNEVVLVEVVIDNATEHHFYLKDNPVPEQPEEENQMGTTDQSDVTPEETNRELDDYEAMVKEIHDSGSWNEEAIEKSRTVLIDKIKNVDWMFWCESEFEDIRNAFQTFTSELKREFRRQQ